MILARIHTLVAVALITLSTRSRLSASSWEMVEQLASVLQTGSRSGLVVCTYFLVNTLNAERAVTDQYHQSRGLLFCWTTADHCIRNTIAARFKPAG